MTVKVPELVIGAGVATACWAILSIAVGDLSPMSSADPAQAQAIAAKQMVWLTVAQIFVGAFGLAGLFLTLRHTRRTADAGIDAANAAQLSTRAAIALQMPVIQIKPFDLGFGTYDDGSGEHQDYCCVDWIVFSNLGQTKAYPIELRCGSTVGHGLPLAPIYETISTFPVNFILEPDPKVTPRKKTADVAEIRLSFGEREAIERGDLNIWFYCSLIFDDFMQVRHEARFCWQWYGGVRDGAFRSDPTPSYNLKT